MAWSSLTSALVHERPWSMGMSLLVSLLECVTAGRGARPSGDGGSRAVQQFADALGVEGILAKV